MWSKPFGTTCTKPCRKKLPKVARPSSTLPPSALGFAGSREATPARSRTKPSSPGKSTATRGCGTKSTALETTTDRPFSALERTCHPAMPAVTLVRQVPVSTTASSFGRTASPSGAVNSKLNSGLTRPTGSRRYSTLRAANSAARRLSSSRRAVGARANSRGVK